MTAKKILFVLFSVVALFIVTIIALVLLIDFNAYKPRIEAAVSDALGMEVRINGKLGIVLLPHFGASMENIRIKSRGTDFIAAEKVRIGLQLIPLIKREVRISAFELVKPKFTIELEKSGGFNFERIGGKPDKKGEFPVAILDIGKFLISGGELSYSNKKTGDKMELIDFDLTIRNLSFGGDGSDPLRNISFQGDFRCKEIKMRNAQITNLIFSVKGKGGIFDVDPVTMNLFGGTEKGKVTIDITGVTPLYSMQYSASKFYFEEFLQAFSKKKVMKGQMDFSLNLSTRGKSPDEIKRNMNGEVSLRGEHLLLYNIDLDSLLSKVEKSQSFNLVDVGAFFLAGPLGTAFTKGYDFAGVYRETLGGEGMIQRLLSVWKVKNGIAEAKDVALSTKRNRVALKGKLNFVNDQFEDVTVALLDEKGCAKFSQKIHGNFRNPRIEKISTVESIVKPFLKLFKKTERFFTGGECKVFYSGLVQHPK